MTRVSLTKMPTGIPGLDRVLGGGLYRGGMYMISGEPGTGKTVLGNHLAYLHAADNAHVLYVTLLAETHERLLQYVSSFAFFNPAVPGTSMFYLNAYQTLEDKGYPGLIDLLKREIRTHSATLIVLDGVGVAGMDNNDAQSFKRFLHEFQPYLQAFNCTALLLTHVVSGPGVYIGRTMVDGLIELTMHQVGARSVREVQVHKARGSAILAGRHDCEIAHAGILVYPRLEAVLPSEQARLILQQRSLTQGPDAYAFGIVSLDEMLHGGLPAYSSTILLGAPGAGKTVLGLHFLIAGAERDQCGLYVGFYEEPEQLYTKARGVGLDLPRHTTSGSIHINWHADSELRIDQLAYELLALVQDHGIKRLVIDGYDAFRDATIYDDRIGRFFSALTTELRALEVTTIFLVEVSDLWAPTISSPVKTVSGIADNLLFLRYVELRSQLHRLISILKMRTSDYEPSIREFRITSQGLKVADSFASAEAILTGVARLRPESEGRITEEPSP